MAVRYSGQPSTTSPSSAALEIHGEMSMLVSQRKKWRPYYAQLDRKQGILTLRDNDKRKVERFDLSKCVYFPVHNFMYDRPCCFGLILYGLSATDRDELVFSVGSIGPRFTIPAGFTGLDASAYAGRADEEACSPAFYLPSGDPSPHVSASTGELHHGESPGAAQKPQLTQHQQQAQQQQLLQPPPPSLDLVFSRWLRCIRLHCQNTRAEAEIEESVYSRQTMLRFYRSVEVKLNNAKLLPPAQNKTRRYETAYVVSIDGVEVARAYPGSAPASIYLDDFPSGFEKLELSFKEEHKRKRQVSATLSLTRTIEATFDLPAEGETQVPSTSPICYIREATCPQGILIYKELRVLPFSHYERFRDVMRTCLESEFAPLCVHLWDRLPLEGTVRPNFISCLLLVASELRCQLRLIVELLRCERPANPGDCFRGNDLGTQVLDSYCNVVCSTWRSQWLKRVREEALAGQPTPSSAKSSVGSPTSKLSAPTNRPFQNFPPGARPHSLSADQGSPMSTTESSGGPGSPLGDPMAPFSPASGPSQEHEWHSHLISIAVEDLVTHARNFPLQVRWIYSELQSKLGGPQNNSVIRNLVFLRNICPCLLSTNHGSGSRGSLYVGGSSAGAGSSSFGSGSLPGSTDCSSSSTSLTGSQRHTPALTIVAKALISLINPNMPTKAPVGTALSPEQIKDHHEKLTKQFGVSITTQLSHSDYRVLDQLLEQEAYQASQRSLSRELAYLAYLLFDSVAAPGARLLMAAVSPGTSMRSVLEGLNPPPVAATQLWNALIELNTKTRVHLMARAT